MLDIKKDIEEIIGSVSKLTELVDSDNGEQVTINLDSTDDVRAISFSDTVEEGISQIKDLIAEIDTESVGKSIGHYVRIMVDTFLIFLGSIFIFVGSVSTIYTTPPIWGALIPGALLLLVAIVRIFLRLRQTYLLNKLASLIVSSELRFIPDIVRFSKMSEDKVIKRLRVLISNASSLKLGNDARYLKGAKLNLQAMEITLSDKYMEKEPWNCAYCRSKNLAEDIVCQSCKAPKKKIS